MEFEQILKLIDYISASKVTSFEYEEGDMKLSMKCGNHAEPVFAIQQGAGTFRESGENVDGSSSAEPQGNVVKSPLVGTFYTAPSEEAEPFVKVGDHVKKGQILAIVEAMKLMNEIESDFDGEIAEIYVENGQSVEYGKPLFRII